MSPTLLLLSLSAWATERLAVLELGGQSMAPQELGLLTDTVRGAVVDAVKADVQVMTRENMEVMLTDMGLDASCVSEGSCEVETARNLGVDYVMSGQIVAMGSLLVVSLKLHETDSGRLLSSKQVRGEGSVALLDALDAPSRELVEMLGAPAPTVAPAPELASTEAALAALQREGSPAAPGATGTHTVKGVRFERVVVPAGRFVMGSPTSERGRYRNEAQVEVTLTRPYEVMKTEVTQGLYRAVTGQNPSGFSSCGDGCPVEQVSWLEAVSFANALSSAEGLTPAYQVSGKTVTWDRSADGWRLPTEAEWEYAARAGERTVYAGSDRVDEVGWYEGNSGGKTHPACGKRPNGWGLCDMTGNVWEWTWDWFAGSRSGGTDPAGPASGSYRVFRGGSWYSVAQSARVARRDYDSPGFRRHDLGFRLVRSLDP